MSMGKMTSLRQGYDLNVVVNNDLLLFITNVIIFIFRGIILSCRLSFVPLRKIIGKA